MDVDISDVDSEEEEDQDLIWQEEFEELVASCVIKVLETSKQSTVTGKQLPTLRSSDGVQHPTPSSNSPTSQLEINEIKELVKRYLSGK